MWFHSGYDRSRRCHKLFALLECTGGKQGQNREVSEKGARSLQAGDDDGVDKAAIGKGDSAWTPCGELAIVFPGEFWTGVRGATPGS